VGDAVSVRAVTRVNAPGYSHQVIDDTRFPADGRVPFLRNSFGVFRLACR
jgi:hypothetical protein